MTTIRFRSAVVCLALLVFVVGGTASLGAQTRPDRRAPVTVRVNDLVENAEAVETQIEEFRYYRPIINLGHDYTLKAGDTVRTVRSALADVVIEGHVDGDVVVTLGKATLAPTAVIDGSLVVIGGSATVMPGASVRRDFVVIGGTADTPPTFSARGEHVVIGSPMLGDTLRALVPWLTNGLLLGRLIVPSLPWVWTIVFISFFIGLVLNHVFDRQVSACAETLARRPLSAFFMGLLVLLLAGPLLAIVAASIIGLAVVPFAIAALIVGGMLGKIGVIRAIGRGVIAEGDSGSRLQSLRSYTIGSAAIVVAYMVPVLGILTWAMIGVFGLGAAMMTFAATLRRERPTPAPKAPVEPPPVVPPPASHEPSFRSEPPPAYGPAASAYVAAASSAPPESAAEAMVSEGSPPGPAPSPAMPHASLPPLVGGDLSLYPRAGFLDRLAAFALDVVLIAIASAFFRAAFFFRGPADDGGFMFVVLIYIIAFTAWKGTTLGGIICSLRVVRTNGAELRFVDALVRGLSSIFSIAALGIGCFWMLNDAERQMWHDKIAGTVVVKVPREMVLA